MPSKIEVKLIDNSEAFKNALPEQINAALIAIGMTAEGYAKQRCPVDTGRLRNSITNEPIPEEKAVIVGTAVEYGPFVELGTSKQRAQPFLVPAVTQHTDEYRDLIRMALEG